MFIKNCLKFLCLILLGLLTLSAMVVSAAGNDQFSNNTGKTIIRRVNRDAVYNTTFMLISAKGTIIVADPSEMPAGIPADIVTVTHDHGDHYDPAFVNANSGKKSVFKEESFSYKDVKVTGIASAHLGDSIDKQKPTNVIYLFEIDGLRIVHMGDIGQSELTAEQLKVLGKVDIAFMQFSNPLSDMTTLNGKGLRLMQQLNPQVIIPTHNSPGVQKKIEAVYGPATVVENILTISKDDLKDGKKRLIILKNTL